MKNSRKRFPFFFLYELVITGWPRSERRLKTIHRLISDLLMCSVVNHERAAKGSKSRNVLAAPRCGAFNCLLISLALCFTALVTGSRSRDTRTNDRPAEHEKEQFPFDARLVIYFDSVGGAAPKRTGLHGKVAFHKMYYYSRHIA